MIRQLLTLTESETPDAGVQLAALLHGGDVIAMEGPLGAGKTCLARGIALGLGLASRDVASPTFSILHEHPVAEGNIACLYHIDAYRLGGAEDLESIGWEECLDDASGVVLIEWASRIETALPLQVIHVEMTYLPEGGRGLELRWSGVGERFGSLWDDVVS